MFRSFVVSCLSFFIGIAVANAQVHFEEHPLLNQNVSHFTEAFIKAMIPEFDKEQTSFNFDLKNSDLSRGEIYARFDGVTSKTEIDGFSTPMVVGADIMFSITDVNKKEYGLNIDLSGQVSETQTLINFMQQALMPKCLENSAMAGKNKAQIEEICALLGQKFSNNYNKPVENFKKLILEWKKQALLLVENSEHKLKGDSAEILRNYIDQRIIVQDQGPGRLYVNIDITNLGRDLAKDYPEVVDKLRLNIIKVNAFEAMVNSQYVEYNISLTKLHSKRTIDKGMKYGAGFQGTIENPESGEKLGLGMRDMIRGNNIDSLFNLFMGANKIEVAKAIGKKTAEDVGSAVSGVLQRLGLGETPSSKGSSKQTSSSEEEDLGL